MANGDQNCYNPTGSPSSIKQNCRPCQSCVEPALVTCTQADISNAVCTPILAKVVQNCIYLNKNETEYPSNLVFATNIPRVAGLTGRICINTIELSYSCIGINPGTGVANTNVYIDGNVVPFSFNIACACAGATGAVNLFNSASGQIKTKICCCTDTNPPTQLTDSVVKIVEKQLDFGVCNFKITLTGTLGTLPFIATNFGTIDTTVTPNVITAFNQYVPLTSLDFNKMNFAGKICLPTNTTFEINEDFSSILSIDCVKSNVTDYTVANDPLAILVGAVPYSTLAGFVATADVSVAITKTIYAVLNKKLAVLSTAAPIQCIDGSIAGSISPLNPCTGNPCPGGI